MNCTPRASLNEQEEWFEGKSIRIPEFNSIESRIISNTQKKKVSVVLPVCGCNNKRLVTDVYSKLLQTTCHHAHTSESVGQSRLR
jgi:hypothetical protein